MALTSELSEKGTSSSIQVVDLNDADTAAQIIPESEGPLDPAVALRLRYVVLISHFCVTS
jgi:hypothetical protein